MSLNSALFLKFCRVSLYGYAGQNKLRKKAQYFPIRFLLLFSNNNNNRDSSQYNFFRIIFETVFLCFVLLWSEVVRGGKGNKKLIKKKINILIKKKSTFFVVSTRCEFSNLDCSPDSYETQIVLLLIFCSIV